MTEKLKVSIQLNLEIPIEYNEAGHRKSPTELVAPYIDRLYSDMRVQGLPYGDYEFNDAEDLDEYAKLEAIHFSKDPDRLAQIRKEAAEKTKADTDKILHQMWKDGQDRITKEHFGISWDEFTAMTDEQRQGLPLLTDGVGDASAKRLQERKPPHELGRGN